MATTGLGVGGPFRAYGTFTAKAAAAATAFTSAGVLYLPLRMTSALWNLSGVVAEKTEIAWLPPAKHPIGYAYIDGKRVEVHVDSAYYRMLDYILERRLAGKTGPAITEVVTAVEETQATAAASSTAVTELQQQTQANAESLYVVRQVAVNNSLVGANQIPAVEL